MLIYITPKIVIQQYHYCWIPIQQKINISYYCGLDNCCQDHSNKRHLSPVSTITALCGLLITQYCYIWLNVVCCQIVLICDFTNYISDRILHCLLLFSMNRMIWIILLLKLQSRFDARHGRTVYVLHVVQVLRQKITFLFAGGNSVLLNYRQYH